MQHEFNICKSANVVYHMSSLKDRNYMISQKMAFDSVPKVLAGEVYQSTKASPFLSDWKCWIFSKMENMSFSLDLFFVLEALK